MNELRALANHLEETGEEENLEIILRKMEALSSQEETEQPVPRKDLGTILKMLLPKPLDLQRKD
mgnify:CR=1 FL=1